MWQQLCHSSSLPDPLAHFGDWVYLMRHHRGYWKRLVRRAIDHAGAQRRNLYVVERFHRDILTTLHGHGFLHLDPPYEVQDKGDMPHACMLCGICFKSRGGCGAHLFRAHGIVNPVRSLFDTTQCCSCLREFHTFSKLKTHLLCVPRCRQELINRKHFVGPAAGAGSSINMDQETIHDGVLPPLRAQGPAFPPAAHREEIVYDIELYELICLAWIDATTLGEGERVVRDCVRSRPISWRTCWLTLQQLKDDAIPEQMPEEFLSVQDFCTLLDRLSQVHAWDFLTERETCGPGHWHRDLRVLEEWCEAEVASDHSQTGNPSPSRGFGTIRYVLHLYLGRRR